MGYDYELLYRKGFSNVVADALFGQLEIQLNAIFVVTSDLIQRIQHSWAVDHSLVHLIHNLQRKPKKHLKYTWHNNQLRRQRKLVIGQYTQLIKDLLKLFHSTPNGGHSGATATMKRLGNIAYWKGLKRDVHQFVRACPCVSTIQIQFIFLVRYASAITYS